MFALYNCVIEKNINPLKETRQPYSQTHLATAAKLKADHLTDIFSFSIQSISTGPHLPGLANFSSFYSLATGQWRTNAGQITQ